MAQYTKDNREILDKTPVEMPLGYEKPESLSDMIARMVRATNEQAKRTGAFETIEEADDFEVDDQEMQSPYQFNQMQEEFLDNPAMYKTEKPEQKPDVKPEPAPEKPITQ